MINPLRAAGAPLFIGAVQFIVGIFPKTAGPIHSVPSLIAFLFGGHSAIASHRLERRPMNYFSVIMGVVSLSTLALYAARLYPARAQD